MNPRRDSSSPLSSTADTTTSPSPYPLSFLPLQMSMLGSTITTMGPSGGDQSTGPSTPGSVVPPPSATPTTGAGSPIGTPDRTAMTSAASNGAAAAQAAANAIISDSVMNLLPQMAGREEDTPEMCGKVSNGYSRSETRMKLVFQLEC